MSSQYDKSKFESGLAFFIHKRAASIKKQPVK
ncbi:MAG: hypothetical protein H6Q17_1516 [Bacteroidetes bacterium]|nr:hypothetical protein [Bacteroidota bacterium]